MDSEEIADLFLEMEPDTVPVSSEEAQRITRAIQELFEVDNTTAAALAAEGLEVPDLLPRLEEVGATKLSKAQILKPDDQNRFDGGIAIRLTCRIGTVELQGTENYGYVRGQLVRIPGIDRDCNCGSGQSVSRCDGTGGYNTASESYCG